MSETCSYVLSLRPATFCAEPAQSGSSYCSTHHALCYRRAKHATAEWLTRPSIEYKPPIRWRLRRNGVGG